jgi:hypothetical protein
MSSRIERQRQVAAWELPQRGVRLLEEAIELYQATGATAEMAHRLVDFVFSRPVGEHPSDLPLLIKIKRAARAVVDERYRKGSDWEALSDAIGALADLVGGGTIEDQQEAERKRNV